MTLGQYPHPIGEVAANGDGEHVGVRTLPRTAADVALCGAGRPRLVTCLRSLGSAPLTARLGASLGRLTAALGLLGDDLPRSLGMP